MKHVTETARTVPVMAVAGKPYCDEHCARAYVRSFKEKPKKGKETEAA